MSERTFLRRIVPSLVATLLVVSCAVPSFADLATAPDDGPVSSSAKSRADDAVRQQESATHPRTVSSSDSEATSEELAAALDKLADAKQELAALDGDAPQDRRELIELAVRVAQFAVDNLQDAARLPQRSMDLDKKAQALTDMAAAIKKDTASLAERVKATSAEQSETAEEAVAIASAELDNTNKEALASQTELESVRKKLQAAESEFAEAQKALAALTKSTPDPVAVDARERIRLARLLETVLEDRKTLAQKAVEIREREVKQLKDGAELLRAELDLKKQFAEALAAKAAAVVADKAKEEAATERAQTEKKREAVTEAQRRLDDEKAEVERRHDAERKMAPTDRDKELAEARSAALDGLLALKRDVLSSLSGLHEAASELKDAEAHLKDLEAAVRPASELKSEHTQVVETAAALQQRLTAIEGQIEQATRQQEGAVRVLVEAELPQDLLDDRTARLLELSAALVEDPEGVDAALVELAALPDLSGDSRREELEAVLGQLLAATLKRELLERRNETVGLLRDAQEATAEALMQQIARNLWHCTDETFTDETWQILRNDVARMRNWFEGQLRDPGAAWGRLWAPGNRGPLLRLLLVGLVLAAGAAFGAVKLRAFLVETRGAAVAGTISPSFLGIAHDHCVAVLLLAAAAGGLIAAGPSEPFVAAVLKIVCAVFVFLLLRAGLELLIDGGEGGRAALKLPEKIAAHFRRVLGMFLACQFLLVAGIWVLSGLDYAPEFARLLWRLAKIGGLFALLLLPATKHILNYVLPKKKSAFLAIIRASARIGYTFVALVVASYYAIRIFGYANLAEYFARGFVGTAVIVLVVPVVWRLLFGGYAHRLHTSEARTPGRFAAGRLWLAATELAAFAAALGLVVRLWGNTLRAVLLSPARPVWVKLTVEKISALFNSVGAFLARPLLGEKTSAGKILLGVVVLLAFCVVMPLVKQFFRALAARRSGWAEGPVATITALVRYVLMVVGFLVAFAVAGIPLTNLAVVVGAVTVGIGFGLQNIINNFICGIILQFERPVRVGDFIEAGGHKGVVTEIRARGTEIRTSDNICVTVPNSSMLHGNVVNWSHPRKDTRLRVPLSVPRANSVDEIRDLLLRVAWGHRSFLDAPPPEVHLKSMTSAAMNFELLVWTTDLAHAEDTTSDINYRIEAALRANDTR